MKQLFKKLSLSVALLMSLSNIVMAEAGAESYVANIGVKSHLDGLERVKHDFLPRGYFS
jgi:hypothetical protein